MLAAPCHQLPAGSRAAAPLDAGQEDTHRAGKPSPTPAGWDPPLRAPCPSPSPRRVGARTWLAGALGQAAMGIDPAPSPFPSLGCGVLGAEQIFWRPPDNSALYLPPVPPNTLVSAAALCCKFPWSNYVLIYDNPGRAVEGGKHQSSLEVACQGPGSPMAHADHELLRRGAKPADGENVPAQGAGLSPGERRVRLLGNWVLVPVCRAGVSPAWWPVMLPSPQPIQELRTPWAPGLGSSRDDAGMPCMSRWRLPQAGGNLCLPVSPQTRSGMGPDPSPFPSLNGSSRLCLEGLLPAK